MFDYKNKGIFTAYSVSDEGKETFLGSTENMVVNSGLDLICASGSGTIISKCVVSSDTSEIVATTNQIPYIVATTDNVVAETYGAAETAPYYLWYKTTFQFNSGAANGNLTKVAITDHNGNIFSVALFKDANGDPTTIQPLGRERLRVVYEYRVYVNTETVEIKNVKVFEDSEDRYTFTIKPALLTNREGARYLRQGLHINDLYSNGYNNNLLRAYSGPLGTVETTPSDQVFYKTDAFSAKTYIYGDYIRHYSSNFGYNEFNRAEGISSLMFGTSRGSFQVGINPPLIKNNKQFMEITFSLRQSR